MVLTLSSPNRSTPAIGVAEEGVEQIDHLARGQFPRQRGEADDIDEHDRDLGKLVGHRLARAQPRRDRLGQDVLEQPVGFLALGVDHGPGRVERARLVVDRPVQVEHQDGEGAVIGAGEEQLARALAIEQIGRAHV